MAITYGFFNSLNGDRVYNADQMSEYFKGLVSDGVYENVGGALQVMASATPDMNVNIQTGRAIINSKWIENDAVLIVPITAAHVTLNRWTAVVIQLDMTNREISITTIDGTPASNPTKPQLTNGATIKQMCLAYVYVAAGATSITQANITDTRANNSVCGWITGLIEQVDTSTLFDQWETAYNESIADMEDWQTARETAFESWETGRKAAFDSWLATLTSELTIGTYIKNYEKDLTLTSVDSTTIALDWEGYEYETSDVVFVYINGLLARTGYDYNINTSIDPIGIELLNLTANNEWVCIRILKSVLGVSS